MCRVDSFFIKVWGLDLVLIRDQNTGFVLVSAIPKGHSHGPLEPEGTLKINLSQTFILQMSFGVCSSSRKRDRAEIGTWCLLWLQACCSSHLVYNCWYTWWQLALHIIWAFCFQLGKMLGASNKNWLFIRLFSWESVGCLKFLWG